MSGPENVASDSIDFMWFLVNNENVTKQLNGTVAILTHHQTQSDLQLSIT